VKSRDQARERAKSASPSGKLQIAWRWSGKISVASIAKGCRARIWRNAARNMIGQQHAPAIGQIDVET
jgi:hypothetical protein